MHDAYVFEVPVEHLQTVATITAEVLKSSVQEFFPMLDPQVEMNIEHPECWNKDGHADSLARWIVDPALAFWSSPALRRPWGEAGEAAEGQPVPAACPLLPSGDDAEWSEVERRDDGRRPH